MNKLRVKIKCAKKFENLETNMSDVITFSSDTHPPNISKGLPYFDKSKITPRQPGVPELQKPRSPILTKSLNRQYPPTLSHSLPTPTSGTQPGGSGPAPGVPELCPPRDDLSRFVLTDL